jgi:hypothetical protein
VLLQKSNSIGSTCRPDQQKRPVRDRQRDRKLTDDLTIGLDRQRAIPGDTRLSRAHDCDIAEARNAAEEQRGRITQHCPPAASAEQYQLEHRLRQIGARRDDKRAGVMPALCGDHRGSAILDAIRPDGQLAGGAMP